MVEALVVGGELFFDAPGCEYEECAPCAGLEASALGLPVGGDGFLLEVDDGEGLVDGGVDDDALGRGDGGGDEDDALSGFLQLAVAVGGEGGGELGALAGLAVVAVIEDGLLLGALQQEEASEGGVVAACDAEVEAALEEGWEGTAHEGAQGVVGHVALDGVEHAGALDDAVVVAGLEEGAAVSRG